MTDELKTKADAEALINKEGVEYVSVRFTDLIGVQQHFTVPANEFLKDAFTDGMPFDGSSMQGFQAINESDMKLVPDVSTAFIDPFRKHKTLDVAFSIVDPLTDEPYSRDPRQVAGKAEAYLKSTGIADTASFAPEAEFFIFDKVRFENSMQRSFYEVDSIEAPWNSGIDTEDDGTPNIGFKNRVKKGYFPVPPIDHTQDLRDDMVANLQKVGLILERSHHEVAGAGQQEINYRFNSLQHAGDDLMKYKYVVHETAALAGKAATFMPKPIAGDNGTGMHCHQSLWKDGKPLFYDEKGYAGLSDIARWYIGGLIKHSSSVLAFTNPSLNSYHRLVPGYEAPVNLVYSARNRSAAIRIPLAGTAPAAKRIEFRAPESVLQPVPRLLRTADGRPGRRAEPYRASGTDSTRICTSCRRKSMRASSRCRAPWPRPWTPWKRIDDFLTAGDVFTDDLIETWLDLKRGEIDEARLAPTPLEYELYFHI